MTTSGNDLGEIQAVVFDIVGTIVDETGTLRTDTERALQASGHDIALAPTLADDWLKRSDGRLTEISAGRQPWQTHEQVSRETLAETLDEHGVRLPDRVSGWLASAGYRFAPWPQAARQLSDLAALRPVFGLTNAGLAQVAEMSFYAGLRWHAILSTERVRTYKPNPATYQLAIDELHLQPQRTLFVAAHVWDLAAAHQHQFRTAYLSRPDSVAPDPDSPDDPVEVTLSTLDDLLPLIEPSRLRPGPPSGP